MFELRGARHFIKHSAFSIFACRMLEPLELFSSDPSFSTSFSSPSSSPEFKRIAGKPKSIVISDEDIECMEGDDHNDDDVLHGYDSDEGFVVSG